MIGTVIDPAYIAPQGGKGQTAKMWLRRGQIHARKGLEAPVWKKSEESYCRWLSLALNWSSFCSGRKLSVRENTTSSCPEQEGRHCIRKNWSTWQEKSISWCVDLQIWERNNHPTVISNIWPQLAVTVLSSPFRKSRILQGTEKHDDLERLTSQLFHCLSLRLLLSP